MLFPRRDDRKGIRVCQLTDYISENEDLEKIYALCCIAAAYPKFQHRVSPKHKRQPKQTKKESAVSCSYLSEIQPGLRILEIGSREVIGPSSVRHLFGGSEYVGFDYYPGSNVDVAGDVHQLSSYFSPDEKFDLIFSMACFEHFAMPWIVAPQIAKMLKVGGIVYVATHFSYAAHERPWNFFQFSDMGLRVLFPECMGFECIAAGMSDPIVGRFSSLAAEWDRYKPIRAVW